MRFAHPQVYRLAHTDLHDPGVAGFLEAVGAAGWKSDASSDGEVLIELAGRVCYRSWAPGLNPNVTRTRQGNAAYIGNLLEQRHFSVLEHAVATYGLLGVTRVFADELKRHRHLSWSETSLRFVRLTALEAYLPGPFRDNPAAVEIMTDVFERCEHAQHELAELFDLDRQDFATKKEITSAMRRCAPMGLTTSLIVSADLRAWREIIEKRCTEHAEEEIRKVIGLVRDDLAELYPNAMGDLGEEGLT